MAEEAYLNSRRAAVYVGYQPGVDRDGRPLPTAKDKQMRAFYEFVRRRKVETKRDGRRMLFLISSLDRALDRSTEEYESAHAPQGRMQRMEELARRHARGQARVN